MVGDYATGPRRVALMRGVTRWLLLAAGSALAIVLSASAAHATVDSIQYTGPSAPTTGDTLSWTVTSGTPGDALSCTLMDDGSSAGGSVDCTGGSFSATASAPGSYVLEVTDTTDGSPAVDSAPVAVTNPPLPAPAQPTPSAPASPGTDTSPTWTLGLQAGTSDATCSVTGPGSAVVAGPASCSGATWTSDLGAAAASGNYLLSVVANGDNVTTSGQSNPGTAVYTLGALAPTVVPPASPTNDITPVATISNPQPGVTFTCVLTGPDGSPLFSGACPGDGTYDTSSGADGTYTLVVTADGAGGSTASTTVSWLRDTSAPPGPTVSTPPALTSSYTVTLTISDSDSSASLLCRLTGPDGRQVSNGQCPSDGTFDTTGSPDGTFTLVVTANDRAGNKSTTTVSWVRDTTAPPGPSVSTPVTPTNATSVHLTISDADPTAALTCSLTDPGGATVSSGPCPSDGTFATTGHPDGVYTLVVTATDGAGNTSSTTVSWTRDTVPPAKPTVTGSSTASRTRTPSFTVTDPDAVATWQCTVTGPSPVLASACGPTTTLDLSSAADGTYTLSVVAVDAAGNASVAGTASYVLDTTPPPAPSVSAPPALTNNTSVDLTISDSEAGAVLTCVLTGPGGITLVSGGCPATFDTSSGADGTYGLVVTATDAAGNASSTTVSWVRDTTPPPAPTVTAPLSPGKNTAAVFTVTEAESGVTYTCTVAGPSVVTAVCGPTTNVDLASAADGVYTLSVTATDAAGNVSLVGTATYTLDTTPPTAPVVSATDSPSQGRHPTYSVTGIETGGTLSCTLTGPAGFSATHGCSSLVTLDLSGQPDGTYTFTVTVTDAAGNVSAAGTASYLLDTTAPAAPVVTGPAGPSNNRTLTLAITAEPGATVSCTIARYYQQVWFGACPADGVLDLSRWADGEFEISVLATDAAGNVSAETTVIYTLDTTAPAAPVLTEPASPSPIQKPVWLFTAEEGTTATCTITGPSGQVVFGPQQCASPFTGLLKGLPDGTYTLTVVVSDAAGNVSAPVSSFFVLDRQAPVPPTVTPPRSPDSSRDPAWHITAPAGATLTCTLLRGSAVISGPGACPAGGVFSLNGMPDGTYTLRVTATDRAGNVSATSTTTYVLDTARPEVPHLDYTAPSPSLSVKPYWGFSLPAGTTGRCELLHDGAVLESKFGCKGAVSFDLTGQPIGVYSVRIVAVDGAGNESRPLVAFYVLGSSAQVGPPSTGSTGVTGPGGGGNGGGGGGNPSATPRHLHAGGVPLPVVPGFLSPLANPATVLGESVGSAGKKVVQAVKHVASSILPEFHDQVTEHVSKAVQGVVNAVTHAGGGAGFPLLLLFIVLGFLLVQNRIDRKDPKLALASVAADDTIEFRPPPSRRP